MPTLPGEKQNRGHLAPLKKGADGTKITFPYKLWEVLEAGNKRDNFIRWDENGTTVVVDEKRYEDEVMFKFPGFMQISSFANFRRQMRWYSFDWREPIPGLFEFSHPFFQRGREDLLSRILTRRIALNQRRPTPERTKGTRGRPRKRVDENYHRELKECLMNNCSPSFRKPLRHNPSRKRAESSSSSNSAKLPKQEKHEETGSDESEMADWSMWNVPPPSYVPNECIYTDYGYPYPTYTYNPDVYSQYPGMSGQPAMNFSYYKPDMSEMDYYNMGGYDCDFYSTFATQFWAAPPPMVYEQQQE